MHRAYAYVWGDHFLKEYTNFRISFAVSLLIIIILVAFFIVASLISSTGYAQRANAINSERIKSVFESEPKERFTIIIDPGHGGEDPGAVVTDISEKNINLAIALKLQCFAALSDVDIVMTRTDDRMLYNSGEEGRKKFYDLYNRLRYTEEYPNAIFISIHQNKFPLESCHGMQVFYGIKNSQSVALADFIQSSNKLIAPDNHRVTKPGNNIYLLENANTPSVIIECGFISNPAEARLLSDDEYTDKIAFSIYCGIAAFLEDVKNES